MSKVADLRTINTKDYGVKNEEIQTKSKLFRKAVCYFKFCSNSCSVCVFVANWKQNLQIKNK